MKRVAELLLTDARVVKALRAEDGVSRSTVERAVARNASVAPPRRRVRIRRVLGGARCCGVSAVHVCAPNRRRRSAATTRRRLVWRVGGRQRLLGGRVTAAL